jgi:hypothetical protein
MTAVIIYTYIMYCYQFCYPFKGLMKLVLGESMMKSIVEVSRVFGNLTGQKQVRDFLHQQQGKLNFLLILVKNLS